MTKLLLTAAALACAPVLFANDIYTPLEGDHVLDIPEVTGRWVNDGFSLTFYGVPTDKYGDVAGAGDLLNIEIYAESPDDPDFTIARIYNYYDTEAWMNGNTDVRFGPGDMMGGFIYEFWGFIMPMGSYLSVYDAMGEEEALGLVGPGSTLTVTDLGEGIYHFEFDLYTIEDAHITGEWEGILADYVEDCPDLSGIANVTIDYNKAEYFDLQGVRVANPIPGKVYIVVNNGRSHKVRL